MWWFVVIIAVAVIALAVILARRGSSGGAIGYDTPHEDPRINRAAGDSGFGGG